MGHRDRFDRIAHPRGFRRIALEKLASRRHIEKERAHFDHRARTRGRGARSAQRGALNLDLSANIARARAGNHAKSRHACDRRQRLAAKSEGVNGGQIIAGRDLARRVRRHRQQHFIGSDSRAVVGYAHEIRATALDLDKNPARARVKRVLHEFLDHARGTLDHFACSDLVHQLGSEHANGHVTSSSPKRSGSVGRDQTRVAKA